MMLVASIVAAMAAPTWKMEDGAILSEGEATRLLKQCSRSAPEAVTGFWTPTKEQIADLEVRAPAALAARLKQRDVQPLETEFLRQYVGILSNNVKQIYVNAFPKNMERYLPDWRVRAHVVCDGGPDNFGAAFDPATANFTHFGFNGLP